jgi:hypothetical protein
VCGFEKCGGSDGTRIRGLLRDRQASETSDHFELTRYFLDGGKSPMRVSRFAVLETWFGLLASAETYSAGRE